MAFRTPWDPAPSAPAPSDLLEIDLPAKRRGRRPAAEKPGAGEAADACGWRFFHLTISGPAASVAAFAESARGAGVVPWAFEGAALEEDVFNLAAAQPPARRSLTIAGCHILARQFRERVATHQAQAAARVGHSRACPFDLHTLLPVPTDILQLGPSHPRSLAWMAAHWGVTDGLRKVTRREGATMGRRLPVGQAVAGYSFFTISETPDAAIVQLGVAWPALRFVLLLRPLA
jgi:hypothetical protein